MLKNLLLIMVLSISFSSADGQRAFYNEGDYEEVGVCELQNENQVLKLKLEVYKLKEEVFELQKTLKELNGDKEVQRVKAIKKLRRELRESRKISLDVGFK